MAILPGIFVQKSHFIQKGREASHTISVGNPTTRHREHVSLACIKCFPEGKNTSRKSCKLKKISHTAPAFLLVMEHRDQSFTTIIRKDVQALDDVIADTYPTIIFTMSYDFKCIQFLHLNIHVADGCLKTALFSKTTDNHEHFKQYVLGTRIQCLGLFQQLLPTGLGGIALIASSLNLDQSIQDI